MHELIEGRLTERTVADTANVVNNTYILCIGAGNQHGFNATWVDFLLSFQKQPVPTLMRRTEHLSRLGSAGHRRWKPLRLRRTCGQGNRRAVQLFNLHHLLDTVWEESEITATLSPCKWSFTMASRNSLVGKATEDLISGATPLKPSCYVFQPPGMRLSTPAGIFRSLKLWERWIRPRGQTPQSA